MHIGTIVAVGITNEPFFKTLQQRGYTVLPVARSTSVLEINTVFDFMIISDEVLTPPDTATLERLYFVSGSVPIGLLINDPETISSQLLTLLCKSSLELFYSFEITQGTLYSKIDRLIIAARLNRNRHVLQKHFNSREMLENEISLREQILAHERGVNTNIIDSITAGLIIFDLDGTIILANGPAKTIFSRTNRDIIGSGYKSSLPQVFGEMMDSILAGLAQPDDHPYYKKCTVDTTYYEVYGYRMLSYQNKPNGILMLINDITEQQNLSVLLYRSEKLATVGTMLSGIAHELRNPLSIISARIQRALIKKQFTDEWLVKNFNSIQAQTTRCATIVNSLLNFTRNTATSAGYHEITEILNETLTYVDYQNSFDSITVEKIYTDDLRVFGDRSRFVQVFLNLITNAADAMNGKGILTIRTVRKPECACIVEIHDNGPGIDESIKHKIFDPFFTTKEPGKGTGLGLAIVYKIIQESKGKIRFDSKPGSTSFFVELPSEKESFHERTNTTR